MQTTYTEIFAEISRQISARKKDLLQRTLLVTWPFILCIIIVYAYKQVTGQTMDVWLYSSITNMIITGVVFFSVFVYTAIVSSILRIEKMIWIDSFFDKKNLTVKESFTISRKLFWPFLKLSFIIFFRYYLWIWVLLPAVIVGTAMFASSYAMPENSKLLIFLGIYLVMIVGIIVAIYYIRIRLRYVRFVFLDSYKGGSLDFGTVIEKTNQLNQIFKSESFKKALVSQLGVDTAQGVATMVTNSITNLVASGASKLGGIGGDSIKAVAGIANVYANEYTKQIADLSRVVSMYVLYREALKQHGGSEQIDNEYVYSLK